MLQKKNIKNVQIYLCCKRINKQWPRQRVVQEGPGLLKRIPPPLPANILENIS